MLGVESRFMSDPRHCDNGRTVGKTGARFRVGNLNDPWSQPLWRPSSPNNEGHSLSRFSSLNSESSLLTSTGSVSFGCPPLSGATASPLVVVLGSTTPPMTLSIISFFVHRLPIHVAIEYCRLDCRSIDRLHTLTGHASLNTSYASCPFKCQIQRPPYSSFVNATCSYIVLMYCMEEPTS